MRRSPQVIAIRAGMMVSPTAVKTLGADFATKAVGAGPYKLGGGGGRVLDQELGAGSRALRRLLARASLSIERLVFRPISDETVRLANLRSGTRSSSSTPCRPRPSPRLSREANITLKQSPRPRLQRLLVQLHQGALRQSGGAARLRHRRRPADQFCARSISAPAMHRDRRDPALDRLGL